MPVNKLVLDIRNGSHSQLWTFWCLSFQQGTERLTETQSVVWSVEPAHSGSYASPHSFHFGISGEGHSCKQSNDLSFCIDKIILSKNQNIFSMDKDFFVQNKTNFLPDKNILDIT